MYYAAYFRRGAHEPIYLGGLLNGTASSFVYLHKVTTPRLAFYAFSRMAMGDNQQTLRCAPALMTNSFVFFSDANAPPSVTVGDRRLITSVHIPGIPLRVVFPFPSLTLGRAHVRWKVREVGNNAIVTYMGMRLDGLFACQSQTI